MPAARVCESTVNQEVRTTRIAVSLAMCPAEPAGSVRHSARGGDQNPCDTLTDHARCRGALRAHRTRHIDRWRLRARAGATVALAGAPDTRASDPFQWCTRHRAGAPRE